ADDRLPGECQIGESLQDAADPKTRRKWKCARHVAAGETADQQCRKPNSLDDCSVFVAREPEVSHNERSGHDARKRVGEFEQNNNPRAHKGNEKTFAQKKILKAPGPRAARAV